MPGEREDFAVARVAALARLRLSPAEEALYQKQLAQILEFVALVRAATFDRSAVPDAAAFAPAVERPDAITPSLPPELALANAPDAPAAPRLVRVPKVIG